jgi:mRNA interferase HigB
MRIVSRKTLRQFWELPQHADAEQPLRAWFREVSRADWAKPAEIKAHFQSASILGNSRIVFNIAGKKYRLVVRVNFPYRVVYIRFVGTHRQYDKIDAKTV